jgi:hypothetical protein
VSSVRALPFQLSAFQLFSLPFPLFSFQLFSISAFSPRLKLPGRGASLAPASPQAGRRKEKLQKSQLGRHSASCA